MPRVLRPRGREHGCRPGREGACRGSGRCGFGGVATHPSSVPPCTCSCLAPTPFSRPLETQRLFGTQIAPALVRVVLQLNGFIAALVIAVLAALCLRLQASGLRSTSLAGLRSAAARSSTTCSRSRASSSWPRTSAPTTSFTSSAWQRRRSSGPTLRWVHPSNMSRPTAEDAWS